MRIRVLAVAVALGVAVGCSSPDGGPSRQGEGSGGPPHVSGSTGHPGEPGERGRPMDGGERSGHEGPYWVNPHSGAAAQARDWERAGRAEDARLIRRISEQPVAEWLGDDPDGARRQAETITSAASREGRRALFVAYNIPHRDCGRYSTGGAPDGAAYQRWIDAVVQGLGDRAATVVLEPDAVPHLVDGCTPPELHQERYDLLSYAVRRLTELPGTTVYLDAGNATWIKNVGALADALRRAGIGQADGFALNVANFQTTEASREFGHQLSGALGGARFVIDTSRNGKGPMEGGGGRREDWCNPPGRALGRPPTTDTGDPLVDAYLWIKQPGDSDGECRGGPPAGQWWPDYALTLARNAEQ
ncbi:endoglucanase [Wenjunlia vitaminophila]|uniref:Glucanase n=2 Tax=Wenjunlia vitaminophila TaxID=76728 RepID=A0A0T6LS45_WENVI|nr:endoglucanase [Wenjunlia vitaminophila]